MKFKKAALADILGYVLIFTLFSAFVISYLFNNITQERRSMTIDVLNKEAMTLQAKLEGYSNYSSFSHMYRNGAKITEYSRIQGIKNIAIAEANGNITNYFNEERNKKQLKLKSIDIQILDGPDVKDTASVKITVKYEAGFRSPFNKENGADGNSSTGGMMVDITDTATRVIENPVRQRNLK